METNPELDDDVAERPEDKVVDAEITEVRKGTREELHDITEEDLPDWASMDDVLLELDVEHEYDGNTISETLSMQYYENPDPRSNYGAYLKKYGSPRAGTTVKLDYDGDQNASIRV